MEDILQQTISLSTNKEKEVEKVLPYRLYPAASRAVCDALSKRLLWINTQALPEDLLSAERLASLDEATRQRGASLVRGASRVLYMTGRFLDLSDEHKTYPGMQAQVRGALPEMDDAVLGVTDFLVGLTPQDIKKTQSFLRSNPSFGERLADFLEAPTKEDGLTIKRRFDLRERVLSLTSQMAAQSPALVIDPMVKKARRYQRFSEEELARLALARTASLSARRDKFLALYEAWMSQLDDSSGATPHDPEMQVLPSPEPPGRPRGGQILRVGAYTMGVGAVLALGGVLISDEFRAPHPMHDVGLVGGLTLGAILLLVGLIMVVVGLIVKALERR